MSAKESTPLQSYRTKLRLGKAQRRPGGRSGVPPPTLMVMFAAGWTSEVCRARSHARLNARPLWMRDACASYRNLLAAPRLSSKICLPF